MLHKLTAYLIDQEEIVYYANGYNKDNDSVSSNAFIITNKFLYIMGNFLFRDSRMTYSQVKGMKVINLNKISSVTEIRKNISALLILSLIAFVISCVSYGLNNTNEEIDFLIQVPLFSIIISVLFFTLYLFIKNKMLCIEYSGGVLLYNIKNLNEIETIKIIRSILDKSSFVAKTQVSSSVENIF